MARQKEIMINFNVEKLRTILKEKNISMIELDKREDIPICSKSIQRALSLGFMSFRTLFYIKKDLGIMPSDIQADIWNGKER